VLAALIKYSADVAKFIQQLSPIIIIQRGAVIPTTKEGRL
tara:strand:- start:168 stop:287 length:120 start_codon:yes stop_codon:yes gene_type:complete